MLSKTGTELKSVADFFVNIFRNSTNTILNAKKGEVKHYGKRQST